MINSEINPEEVLKCKEIFEKFTKEFRVTFIDSDSPGYEIDIENRTIKGFYPCVYPELILIMLALTVLVEPNIELEKSKQIVSTYLELENIESEIVENSFRLYDELFKEVTS